MRLEVTGLRELSQRFRDFPQEFSQSVRATMEATLYALWGAVPAYPPKPQTSDYIRTGTLGRSLGSSEAGGISGGTPEIYEVSQGTTYTAGEFGTNLEYAPYVIGDDEQQWYHAAHGWWTISSVARLAEERILQLWQQTAEQLAAWIDGQRR